MKLELHIPGHAAIPLERSDLTFGSDAKCDVRLADAHRRHAVLKLVGGRWFLESIDESPLTINGNAQTKAFVNAGDHFQIGSHEIQLEVEHVAIAVAPPSIVMDTPTPVKPVAGRSFKFVRTLALIGLTMTLPVVLIGSRLLAPANKPPIEIVRPDPATIGPSIGSQVTNPPAPVVPPVPPPPKYDPKDLLVLVGFQLEGSEKTVSDELKPEPPVMLFGVGVVFDTDSILISRDLAKFLQVQLEKGVNKAGSHRALTLGAIVDASFRATSSIRSTSCPKLSLLKLKEPLELQPVIRPVNATDVKKMQQNGDVHRIAFQQLPRDPDATVLTETQKHFFIGPYDNNAVRKVKEDAKLAFDRPIPSILPSETLEPGGFLIDSQKAILGTCLPNGDVIFGEELSHAH